MSATAKERAIRSAISPAGTGWRVADLRADTSWCFDVTREDVAVAVAAARATAAVDLLQLEPADLPLGPLDRVVEGVVRELTPGEGRGLALISGLPVDDLSAAEVERLHWAIGLRVGEPVSQNLAGEFMCHVRTQPGIPNRGFAAAGELQFHCDMTEVAGLLSVKVARAGGESAYASLATVHDTMLEERPDLLEQLYRPLYFSRLAEEHEWERPFSIQPVFARENGKWGGFFNTGLTNHALGIAGVPPLSPEQTEAIAVFMSIANRPEIRLQFPLRPGDAAFFHNSMVMHARTNFEDHEDPAERRHLLRLWVDSPRSRERVPWPVRYDFRYGNSGLTRAGVVAGEQTVRRREAASA
ncbi:MAG: TauD/TfdA family dioxygenase [Acidimicrobiia bacterium]